MKRGGFKRPVIERKPVPPYTMTRPVADAVQAFVAQPKDEAHRDRKLLDLGASRAGMPELRAMG